MIGAQNGNPTKLTLPALRDRNERAGLWTAMAAAERADLRPMNERANMRAGGRRIHYLRDIFDLRNRVNV